MLDIVHGNFEGIPVCILKNGRFTAKIAPDYGANVISLIENSSGIELVRTPAGKTDTFRKTPHVFGIPFLFYPNRMSDGRFTFDDRTYAFPINNAAGHHHVHGFLHYKQWQVENFFNESGNASLTLGYAFHSKDSEHSFFPFTFHTALTFSLTQSGLMAETEILNYSDTPMPYGIGFHSAFLIPDGNGLLQLAACGKWDTDSRGLPAGNMLTVPVDAPIYAPGISAYSDSAQGLYLMEKQKPAKNQAALIFASHGGYRVTIRTDPEYLYFVVWRNPAETGYLCVEPQTWIIDALNSRLPAGVSGIQTAEPMRPRKHTVLFDLEHINEK